jgi:death-on-curing protein
VLPISDELQRQRLAVLATIETDPYRSATTIGIEEVLDAHYLIADLFAARGQSFVAVGPARIELLHSALHRQFVVLGGRPKWSTPSEIAATVLFGIAKNHAFYDANKRTALVSVLWLLFEKYNLSPTASQKALEDFVVDVADDQLAEKYARCKASKQSGDPDAEVRFIAYWIKENTRKMQNDYRTITFRELRKIMRRYNFEFENPKDNQIDIVNVEQHSGLFGIGAREVRKRVGRIGYHSETTQVAKSDIKKLRERCGLTFKSHMVDSLEFYDGVNPMNFLLAEYQDILVSLADR